MILSNRYDFVLLFDVQDGNPNGDPDAGNLPRMDAETGRGLITDVCIKRKIRNYVSIAKEFISPNDIYVKEKAVLGRAHVEAFKKLGYKLGEEARQEISPEQAEEFEKLSLVEGLSLENDENEKNFLVISSAADKKEIKQWLKEAGDEISKEAKQIINEMLKKSKPRKPTKEESESGREYMCKTYYDIRTFGAVMSLKTAPNCGQVRGPVQLTFARSIDPIVSSEHSITRMAVATEAEAEKQGGDNRTMGRKHTVPYGLYQAHGFISAHLARQTGFGEEDLKLLWESLAQMFEHDRSAARGLMSTRGLFVFKHDSALGNAHAHDLFAKVKASLKPGIKVPRSFSDYEVVAPGNNSNPVSGVTCLRLVG